MLANAVTVATAFAILFVTLLIADVCIDRTDGDVPEAASQQPLRECVPGMSMPQHELEELIQIYNQYGLAHLLRFDYSIIGTETHGDAFHFPFDFDPIIYRFFSFGEWHEVVFPFTDGLDGSTLPFSFLPRGYISVLEFDAVFSDESCAVYGFFNWEGSQ